MRIVYLGTPDFAVAPLKMLVNAGFNVVAVVTNSDKPVGRKRVLTAPPVKVVAQGFNIPVFQYEKIKTEGVEDLKALKPDLMVTCAFGQILSKEILDIAKHGVINIHASLLPKYRGASPIHYAILNGEEQTGVTIMKTEVGIDTGDMMASKAITIGKEETCGSLFERLSVLGASMIVDVVNALQNGRISYVKQDDCLATYTKIITKELAQIDWSKSAKDIVNQVRAFNPSPIAYTFFNGEQLKIYVAKAVELNGKPGEIIKADKELVVACGLGAVKIERLQKAGGKPLSVEEFLRGNKMPIGTVLG